MRGKKIGLTRSGVFIGSGVLETGEEKIRMTATGAGFTMERGMVRDNWMSFSLKIKEAG